MSDKDEKSRVEGAPAAPAEPKQGPARALLVSALAWLVPGLGHAVLGRWPRAVAFFLVIAGFSALGLLTEGKLYRPDREKPLTYLATVANLGLGPSYLGTVAIGKARGNPKAVTHEHGNAFLLTAGIMNLLLILDAWDLGSGRKS